MSRESYCELRLYFEKKMCCKYYFHNPSGNSSTIIDYEYDKVSEMQQNDTLAKLLTPIQRISLLFITTPQMQNKLEINRTIEYIINNISTPRLYIEINTENNIELNLSQMPACKELRIYDCKGVLPKEYLYHLVKLLENMQTETIMFLYNKDTPLKEDLDEFENIDVQVNHLVIYGGMNTYQLQLKK